MTARQALRHERRQMLAERKRRERIQMAKALLVVVFVIALYALAGTMDYHDDQTQLASWAEQGIAIQRW